MSNHLHKGRNEGSRSPNQHFFSAAATFAPVQPQKIDPRGEVCNRQNGSFKPPKCFAPGIVQDAGLQRPVGQDPHPIARWLGHQQQVIFPGLRCPHRGQAGGRTPIPRLQFAAEAVISRKGEQAGNKSGHGRRVQGNTVPISITSPKGVACCWRDLGLGGQGVQPRSLSRIALSCKASSSLMRLK